MFLGRRIFRLRLPIGERQQLVDSAHRMTGDDPGEHVAQVGFRIDAIHLAGLDERSNDGPATPIRSCKKMILPAKCNRPIILPTSGRKLRSIIAGIRCMDAVSLGEAPTNVNTVGLFTSR